jgi:predicted glycogen debranching enzyme
VSPPLPESCFEWPTGAPADVALPREWLVTNGLGGYAAGTLAQCNTRRYHGLFVPALPGWGRTVVVPRLREELFAGDQAFRLDGEELTDGQLRLPGLQRLRRFTLSGSLPRWEWDLGEAQLSRTFVFLHAENTAFVRWVHLGGAPLRLRIRPFTAFRFHDKPLPPPGELPTVVLRGERVEIQTAPHVQPLRLRMVAGSAVPFVSLPERSAELLLRVERARGLDHAESQLSPGYFECTLRSGESLSLGMTMEPWEALERRVDEAFELERARQSRLLARAPAPLSRGTGARLALAADQFLVQPSVRPQDEAWARASGQHLRSVIAGYPWFTDWGRDTMISLEGLTLATGRHEEAAAILRTFQHYVKDGLIPNLFPEGGNEGLYHTADATLWYFHALARYLAATGDAALLRDVYPTLEEILRRHLHGTRFGIRVDPADGLLHQGHDAWPLTWMDARVDGWVVTPRRGKAVEINALWFNALSWATRWAELLGKQGAHWRQAAERAREGFNARFWNEDAGHLFDVVDTEGGGDDPALRPNQIFALSLDHPVLAPARWGAVLDAVTRHLLTPVGLRTLAPGHPAYRATYDGDLRARDAAYHQGTAWPWLLGHYVDAALRAGRPRAELSPLVEQLAGALDTACVGSLGEIFDASPPWRPRGCFAQAWSVAEVIRHWVRLGDSSSAPPL